MCPAHADADQLAIASKNRDVQAFATAADKSHYDLYTQLTALQYPTIPWPSAIKKQIQVLEDSDSELMGAFGKLAQATSEADIEAVQMPNTTSANRASEEIRVILRLPAKTANGGC